MKKVIVLFLSVFSTMLYAADHVLEATKRVAESECPKSLTLTVDEAADYAVAHNRSLRNASLAVQQAYAQRWQTIASMLPSVDATWNYTNMCKYSMEMNMGGMPVKIEMPDNSALSIQTAIGINGQAIVGAMLNTLAIQMSEIQLEQNEASIRSNIMTTYATVLVLDEVNELMEQSIANIDNLSQMTQRSVEVGAAEQTAADQIRVRLNMLRNNANSNQRSRQLAVSALKVLLDVPVETELVLTNKLGELLGAEAIVRLLGEEFVMAHNLNYQLLEKSVELAKRNVAMAAVAYGPTVAAFHQYSKQHYYGEGGFRMTPPNTIGVSVSMPIWSSGKRAAGVIDKKIALEEARNTFAETRDNLGIQNEQLRYNLQNAYETYMNETDNIDVTKRVMQNVTNKYNLGAASMLELTNASNDLISAQSTYVQAVMSLVQAYVALEEFLNN